MQRWSRLLATVLLVPAGLSAQIVVQEGGADTSTIAITAVAERAVAADRATVLVQVAAEDTAIDAAAVAVGGVRTAVTAALADLGFVEQHAGFWAYAAGPAMQYGRPQPGMSPGFEARAGLRVLVPADRLDELVHAVLNAGATAIPFVQFEATNTDPLREELTREAVARARAQAEAAAAAAGGSLGSLVGITTLPDYTAMAGQTRFFSSGLMDRGVQLLPSDVTVRVTVQASWIFIPR